MYEARGLRRTRAQRVAAFIIDFLFIVAVTSPLWWLFHHRGLADAFVSGVISGVLFAVLWSLMFGETVGSWATERLGIGRADEPGPTDHPR